MAQQPVGPPKMVMSNSASLLHDRLRPENEHFHGGLNTLKPKSHYASTPALMGSPVKGKVLKVREAVSKTLSTSTSAALLSSNPADRKGLEHEIQASFSELPMRIESTPDEAVLLSSPKITQPDGYIAAQRGSFIASLNMSQKQLHDLYKVPQTFFYLRTRASAAAAGSTGSVYDLELISLDQVDKNSYFTLSKEGVTQFRAKLSAFTGLAQWERYALPLCPARALPLPIPSHPLTHFSQQRVSPVPQDRADQLLPHLQALEGLHGLGQEPAPHQDGTRRQVRMLRAIRAVCGCGCGAGWWFWGCAR